VFDGELVAGDRLAEGIDNQQNVVKNHDDAIDVARRSQRLINKDMGWNDVYITFVPKDQLGSDACVTAKKAELEKLKNVNTYDVVPDQGQSRIST
jgi:hypothetical protein